MRVGLARGALLVVAALAAVVPAGAARATENETFGISPFPDQVDGLERHSFSIPLEQGAAFDDAVRVYNRTDQQLDLAVYAADATAGLDGTISVGFRGSKLDGVGAWIDLSKTTVTLPPRAETVVHFRIAVAAANPSPKLGAIVAENTAEGLRSDETQRLYLTVLTTPPSSPTTSRRIRPFILRSPWVIVAILVLLVAGLLVWIGTRRSRRPADAVVAPGGIAPPAEHTPEPSRPVIHRLGTSDRIARKPRERRPSASGRRDRTDRPADPVRPSVRPDVKTVAEAMGRAPGRETDPSLEARGPDDVTENLPEAEDERPLLEDVDLAGPSGGSLDGEDERTDERTELEPVSAGLVDEDTAPAPALRAGRARQTPPPTEPPISDEPVPRKRSSNQAAKAEPNSKKDLGYIPLDEL